MQFKENEIIIDKELNNLDKFVIDFIKVLQKHTPYVLVSGYISILFGRSRVSEDIDLLIPYLDKDKFNGLLDDLDKHFWCLNGDNRDELFDMLKSHLSIRFGRKNKPIPNMELKFIDTLLHKEAFYNKIKVKIGTNILFVSPIELQILYKEEVLKSDKDKEDALHLREVFKDQIKEEKLKYYKRLIKQHDK